MRVEGVTPVRVIPRNPSRYKAFLYACAKVAAIQDGKQQDIRPAPEPK